MYFPRQLQSHQRLEGKPLIAERRICQCTAADSKQERLDDERGCAQQASESWKVFHASKEYFPYCDGINECNDSECRSARPQYYLDYLGFFLCTDAIFAGERSGGEDAASHLISGSRFRHCIRAGACARCHLLLNGTNGHIGTFRCRVFQSSQILECRN